jgi:hypothetical protein
LSSEQIQPEPNAPAPSPEGKRAVRDATIAFAAWWIIANVGVLALHPTGRSGAGMIALPNLLVSMAGAACYPWVERKARGASLGIFAAAIWCGPFLAYGMDAWILTMWEAASSQ